MGKLGSKLTIQSEARWIVRLILSKIVEERKSYS